MNITFMLTKMEQLLSVFTVTFSFVYILIKKNLTQSYVKNYKCNFFFNLVVGMLQESIINPLHFSV